MPLHNARTRRQTRRRTTRRPLTSRRRKGGKKSEEDRLVDDFRKELQRLHKSHNPKDKKTFCAKLKAYAQVVQLDGKTNAFQAAQKLRKMASRAVRQEWNDSALKPNKAPLDAICEAIWNDTSKDGEAFFDKKRRRGLMNFVARFVVPVAGGSLGMVSYIGAHDYDVYKQYPHLDYKSRQNILAERMEKDKNILALAASFVTGTAATNALTHNWFTTEEGISKNIRKHLTQKAKQRRNTPSE